MAELLTLPVTFIMKYIVCYNSSNNILQGCIGKGKRGELLGMYTDLPYSGFCNPLCATYQDVSEDDMWSCGFFFILMFLFNSLILDVTAILLNIVCENSL